LRSETCGPARSNESPRHWPADPALTSWGTIFAIEYLCQGRGAGVEQLILSGALASVPQFVAGIQRLIDGMPEGFAAKLRAIEAAGRHDTSDYSAVTQLRRAFLGAGHSPGRSIR